MNVISSLSLDSRIEWMEVLYLLLFFFIVDQLFPGRMNVWLGRCGWSSTHSIVFGGWYIYWLSTQCRSLGTLDRSAYNNQPLELVKVYFTINMILWSRPLKRHAKSRFTDWSSVLYSTEAKHPLRLSLRPGTYYREEMLQSPLNSVTEKSFRPEVSAWPRRYRKCLCLATFAMFGSSLHDSSGALLDTCPNLVQRPWQSQRNLWLVVSYWLLQRLAKERKGSPLVLWCALCLWFYDFIPCIS